MSVTIKLTPEQGAQALFIESIKREARKGARAELVALCLKMQSIDSASKLAMQLIRQRLDLADEAEVKP